jgi:hypothetical protein
LSGITEKLRSPEYGRAWYAEKEKRKTGKGKETPFRYSYFSNRF